MRGATIFLAVAAVCALFRTDAMASTPFVVRADESPQDSLVTIEVGDAPFTLERTGPRQIDLVTPDLTRDFDISSILALGGGRRLAAVRTVADEDENRLRLTLGCECAYGFSIANGRLLITLRAAEPEAAASTHAARTGGSRYAPHHAPRPFPRPKLASPQSDGTDAVAANPEVLAPETSAQRDDVLAAREHLLQQLSRAADQGLLEFVSDGAIDAPSAPPNTAVSENSPVSEAPQPNEPEVQAPSPETTVANLSGDEPLRPAPPAEAALRARTAIDRSFPVDRTETLVDVAPCIPRETLDLSAWRVGGSFADRIPALRRDLLDEFDEPRPSVIRALAQAYILKGFGVEAEHLLTAFGEVVPEHEVLSELARIVEGRPLSRGGPIASTGPCHGEALLWRRIAGLPHARPGPSDAIWADMAETFDNLPRTLRELVAAPLLSSLIDEGEVKRAEDLDLILSRAPLNDDPALDLARARLLAAGGNAVAAEQLYERLARRDAPEAHESLIRMLDSRLARGAPVSKALADALSDLAFTTRGHPLELAAKTAEIRAHAATYGPMAALVAVRNAMERTPADALVLRDAGHAALERLSPDHAGGDEAAMAYARAVTMYQPLVSTGLDGDPARRRVSRELLDLGLANAALSYLAPAMTRREPGVRLVAAKALVAVDRPEDALEQLTDLSGEEAQKLRAAALARSGDFAGAAEADPGDAARALSAGNWADVPEAEGPRAALASYMADAQAGEAVRTPPVGTTLSGARAAREAARATRALIDEALTDG